MVTVVSRAGLLHRGSGRDDCRGPMTVRGAEARAATGGGGGGGASLSASP